MATAAGLILGAFGAGLSLVGEIQSLIPSQDPSGTKLRFACAQIAPEDNGDSVDSKFDVRMYTGYGQLVGPPQVDKYINGGNIDYEFTVARFVKESGAFTDFRTLQVPRVWRLCW